MLLRPSFVCVQTFKTCNPCCPSRLRVKSWWHGTWLSETFISWSTSLRSVNITLTAVNECTDFDTWSHLRSSMMWHFMNLGWLILRSKLDMPLYKRVYLILSLLSIPVALVFNKTICFCSRVCPLITGVWFQASAQCVPKGEQAEKELTFTWSRCHFVLTDCNVVIGSMVAFSWSLSWSWGCRYWTTVSNGTR